MTDIGAALSVVNWRNHYRINLGKIGSVGKKSQVFIKTNIIVWRIHIYSKHFDIKKKVILDAHGMAAVEDHHR